MKNFVLLIVLNLVSLASFALVQTSRDQQSIQYEVSANMADRIYDALSKSEKIESLEDCLQSMLNQMPDSQVEEACKTAPKNRLDLDAPYEKSELAGSGGASGI